MNVREEQAGRLNSNGQFQLPVDVSHPGTQGLVLRQPAQAWFNLVSSWTRSDTATFPLVDGRPSAVDLATSRTRVVQYSNWTLGFLGYAPPTINRFAGDGAIGSATQGNQEIVIIGTDFATVANSKLESVFYGPSGTEYEALNCSVVIDHQQIRCTTIEGVGENIRWVVTVAGQKSETPTTEYRPPEISDVVVVGHDLAVRGRVDNLICGRMLGDLLDGL